MQIAGSGLAPTLATDSLVHHIAAMQRKEGDWPNYGSARPPLEDGGFSHTAKGIRALSLYAIPGRKTEFDDRIARAAAWLEHAEPRTTEDRAMQILGHGVGRPEGAARIASNNWSRNKDPTEAGARRTIFPRTPTPPEKHYGRSTNRACRSLIPSTAAASITYSARNSGMAHGT